MNNFKPFLFLLLFLATSLQAQENIWPGDVNNNGIVNEVDLLVLGLGYGQTGPKRKDTISTWDRQPAPANWQASAVAGVNLAYADCNGDGVVDANDVEVINKNFGFSHDDVVFVPDVIPVGVAGVNPSFGTPADADLTIRPNTKVVRIPITLGDETIPVANAVGLSFYIKVDPRVFNVAETTFELNGWLPQDNSAIIQKVIQSGRSAPGDLVVAYTKTNNLPSSGNGLIGDITLTPGFIFEDDVPDLKISIDSIILIDNLNNKTPVLGTEIVFDAVGFRDSTTIDSTICQGQPMVFNDSMLTESGTYMDTLMNSVGGDSIITLNLTVLPTFETNLVDTICKGDLFIFAGDTLSTDGNFIDFLQAANGCDSIVTLDLTVNDTLQTVLDRSICAGDNYDFNGLTLSSTGTYRDTLAASNGCPQYVVLNLTVKDTLQTIIDKAICPGGIYQFNGQDLMLAGTYRDTLVAANDCPQYVILNLSIMDDIQTDLMETICPGDSYTFDNQALTTGGTYTQTLQAASGCDSVVVLNLTVLEDAKATFVQTICAGESVDFNGQALTMSGTYRDTLTAANGCDSLMAISLTVLPIPVTNINQTICTNSSFVFNGATLTTAGIYHDTLTSLTGCDSILVLDLKIADRYETELNEIICEGGSLSFNGSNLEVSGTYLDTFVAANGCDSMVTLNLNVAATAYTIIREEICVGGSMTFNDLIITEGGTYMDTLSTTMGCDSLIELDVKVLPILESSMEQTICAGDTLNFYNFVLTETNSYMVILETDDGCDSMVVLNLVVLDEMATSIDSMICPGDNMLFGDQELTEAGTYMQSLTSVTGCDSIITLNLTLGTAGVAPCMSVGIEEELLERIEIYPNPVTHNLFINAPSVKMTGIRLINTTGQVIIERSYTKGNRPDQTELNLQQVVPGVYWILVQTEYGLRQEKIVKF